jgi:serine/threonine protein kinase/tetratricopeptide (TPR) repeat protein
MRCLLQLGLSDFPIEDSPEASAGAETPRAVPTSTAEKPGDRVDRFRLIRTIGEGGFGVVFEAEQEEPVRRRVALKVIKLGMDTKQVVARFEAERQALALMDHPNIAKVLDGGTTPAGRPYFVMELVRGKPITDYCDAERLSLNARLGLFVQVCSAVQHAHQKGIIHRDIKPSNILVQADDPGQPGVPKVIDFGIAKATLGHRLSGATLETALKQFIGTPAYMSPEQASMGGVDVDSRTDIYSLGMLLYELLTAQPAFDPEELKRAAMDEVLRIIREKEPLRPSTKLTNSGPARLSAIALSRQADPGRLPGLVQGDLDWIVMKALEKDRNRRYESADGLAADVLRHLHLEPVLARPPSQLYRLGRLVRRNRIACVSAAAIVATLLIGLGLSTWLYAQERRARRAEEPARARAVAAETLARTEADRSSQVAQFLKDMLRGVGPSVAQGQDTKLLRGILDKTTARLGADLKAQPEVEADLRNTLGNVYEELGAYEQAETELRTALALRSQAGASEDARFAGLLGSLGTVLERRGKLPEAESLHRRTLVINQRLLGTNHLELADSLSRVGNVLFREGKRAEAEPFYRQAFEVARQTAPGSIQEAAGVGNLGNLLASQGKLAESEVALRQALALQRKLLPENHPMAAKTLSNLGNTLDGLGRSAEAEALLRDSVALRRKVLGEHPDLAISLNNLGAWLQREQRFPEAEAIHREALAMRRKLLGPEHTDVAYSLNNLGKVLSAQGKLTEAESAFREALAIRRKRLYNEHPDAIQSLQCLGRTLAAEQKLPEAESVLRETAALIQKVYGSADDQTAVALKDLALALIGQTNRAGAEAVFRETLACRRALLARDRSPGPAAYSALLEALDSLALTHMDEGNLAEAEQLQREALDIGQTHVPDDWRSAAVESRLAECLLEQKRFAEAEPLLLAGYEGLRRHEPQAPDQGCFLPDVARLLVRLYRATGRPEHAAKWEKRAGVAPLPNEPVHQSEQRDTPIVQ